VIVETVLERYPDGRFDILARGRRRFTIESIDQELDWLRGEVEFFDDDEFTPVTPALREKSLACWREIRTAREQTGNRAPESVPEANHPLLSFQLAQAVDDLDFQSLLLRSRSEAERLRKFVEFADEYVSRTQYTAKMKRVAPTNGSGHKPAGL
jgi:Lon protease-like protein